MKKDHLSCGSKYFLEFSSQTLGKFAPIWRACFSDGWRKPPTSIKRSWYRFADVHISTNECNDATWNMNASDLVNPHVDLWLVTQQKPLKTSLARWDHPSWDLSHTLMTVRHLVTVLHSTLGIVSSKMRVPGAQFPSFLSIHLVKFEPPYRIKKPQKLAFWEGNGTPDFRENLGEIVWFGQTQLCRQVSSIFFQGLAGWRYST